MTRIKGGRTSRLRGVQLHDPRLLEYVGAPELARLLSRSPEYWLHHLGREKTLSAALQLQHDDGLILSNVQVLQQLVTVLNRTSSEVMPFLSTAVSGGCHATGGAVLPGSSGGLLDGGNGLVAATYNSGGPGTSAAGDVQCLHVVQ